MSAQQAQFEETIRAMKLALKRRADDSDSDTSIHAPTNRGNKLQRRAKFVRSRRLDTTGGVQSYRKTVNHAGYTRNIISTNPTLYDVDGDVVSGGEESRSGSPIEENAFGDVHLEHLLRPLTAVSELPEHPSLSAPFKSRGLTQMVQEVAEMARRERAALWKAKRLLQRFRGDSDWVPCGTFETEQDEMLLFSTGADADQDDRVGASVSGAPSVHLGPDGLPGMRDTEDASSVQLRNEAEVNGMQGIETADMAVQQLLQGEQIAGEANEQQDATNEAKQENANGAGPSNAKAATDVDNNPTESAASELQASAMASIEQPIDAEAGSEHSSGKDTTGTNPPQHAMTTRARARSPVHSPSPSPTPSDAVSVPQIHPWFLIPPSALPDRDLGLPAREAEESRKLLLLYVQKQEQVVRSLDTLYSGLQRADRIRGQVWAACKAEGHLKDDGRGNMVTEMSDGEDWYDPADWGLDARDLKMGKDGRLGLEKGKDEVDDVGEEGEGRRGGRRRRVNRM